MLGKAIKSEVSSAEWLSADRHFNTDRVQQLIIILSHPLLHVDEATPFFQVAHDFSYHHPVPHWAVEIAGGYLRENVEDRRLTSGA